MQLKMQQLKQSHYDDKGLCKMPWQTSFASQLRPGREHIIWVVWGPGKAELVNDGALRWQLHQGFLLVDVHDHYLRGNFLTGKSTKVDQVLRLAKYQKSRVAITHVFSTSFIDLEVVFCKL